MMLLESLRLALLVFFKPSELDDKLRKVGPHLATKVPLWHTLGRLDSNEWCVVLRALAAIVLGAIAWPIVMAGLGMLWRGHWPGWDSMLIILIIALISLFVGIAGLLVVGISFGVSIGGAASLAGSLVAITGFEPSLVLRGSNQTGLMITAVAFGSGSGLVLGLVAIVTFLLRPTVRWFAWMCTVIGGLIFGVLFARAAGWGSDAVAMGIVLAVLFALGFLAGCSLGYYRVPLYLIELVWQVVLTGLSALAVKVSASSQLAQRLYRLSPVCQDELIWFRLWTLDRQLAVLAHGGDRQFALEAIVEVARSFRQGWAAEAALAAIMAHDLHDCKHIPDIVGAGARLSWFPHAIDLPSVALQHTVTLINEMSQNTEAATRVSDGPGWQVNLRKAQVNVEALQGTLGQMDGRVAGLLTPIVQCWKDAIEQALQGVPQDVGPVEIENFYIAGNPIPPEKEIVFVGREDLFARIQDNLAATQKPTLVLQGQRRTGKTSVLLRLPKRLSANYVPVYVDLQATAPVDSLNRFLYTLAHEAVRQADEKRQIALPPVELADFDYRGPHAFYEWLDQARQRLDGRLLFFAVDEFEKIEEAIVQGQMGIAALDVLRHLIQHHSSWLVLLFAGLRTLEEMSHDWSSYFINVKPIHVSYLDLESARKLILLPTRFSSIRYDERAVESILEATHAQPYLVQAVCFELVQYLNSPRRRLAGPFGQVSIADAQEAIRQAVRSAHIYFSYLWDKSSDPEQLILANLAYGQGERARFGDLSKGLDMTRRAIHEAMEHLKRHELIEGKDGEYCFQVPMMRQWIQNEVSLEAVRVASQSPAGAGRSRGQE